MGDGPVDDAPALGSFGIVALGEEEDLACPLIPGLAGQERRTVARVEGSDVRVRLHEGRVRDGGDRQVRDHVEGVTAASCPAGDGRDDDLRHRADEALDLKDVQASGARGVDLLAALGGGRLGVRALDLVTVAVAASHPLVAAGTEGVSSVACRGAVARQDDGRDRGGLARVVECAVQLVDGAGAEGVADVGAIKGDAHDRHVGALGAAVGLRAARDAAMVGDVGEVESLDLAPAGRVEGVGHEGESTHVSDSNRRGSGRRWGVRAREGWRRCRPASAEGHTWGYGVRNLASEQRLLACNRFIWCLDTWRCVLRDVPACHVFNRSKESVTLWHLLRNWLQVDACRICR